MENQRGWLKEISSSSFSSSSSSFSSHPPLLDSYLDFIPRGRLNDISRKRIPGVARISPRILLGVPSKNGCHRLPTRRLQVWVGTSWNVFDNEGCYSLPAVSWNILLARSLLALYRLEEKDLSLSAVSYRREFRDLESRKIVQVSVLFKSGWDCSTLRRNFWFVLVWVADCTGAGAKWLPGSNIHP